MKNFNKMMAVIEVAQEIVNFKPVVCPTCGNMKPHQTDGEMWNKLCGVVEQFEQTSVERHGHE